MKYIAPKSANPKTFGERLQYARYLQNLSQTRLAEASGISLASIRRYEQQGTEPGMHPIIMFCKTLKVSADYLLGLKDDLR